MENQKDVFCKIDIAPFAESMVMRLKLRASCCSGAVRIRIRRSAYRGETTRFSWSTRASPTIWPSGLAGSIFTLLVLSAAAEKKRKMTNSGAARQGRVRDKLEQTAAGIKKALTKICHLKLSPPSPPQLS